MNVVELKPAFDCEHIAKALRNIADDIEAGELDFDPNIAVVVLGRESQRSDLNGIVDSFNWQSHGLGKASFFACKGLLAAALNEYSGSF